MDTEEDIYELEIIKNTEYNYLNCSNEEKTLRNKLNEILNYCEFVILKDEFKNIMIIDDTELKYHINFLIDKIYFYLFIFEKYIKNEITKEYKSYKIILNQIPLNKMLNLYIDKDPHFQDSKNILLKLHEILDEIENNK